MKWLPGFRVGYMDTIMSESSGQPSWLKPWFDFSNNLQHPSAGCLALLIAVLET